MASGNDGLYVIANVAPESRRADIVFLHGLGGSSHDTWRHGEEGSDNHFFWPEELAKDLKDCAVWSLGYPAGFTRLGKPGMIIEKRAGNLSQKLANAGLGSRPIVFICHSMGGLVVKSLVADSGSNADEDRKNIASMVRGIVFCGTPHRGSSFADAASVLGTMFLGSQAHLDEMRSNAEPLDLMHERFIEWQRRTSIPIESYAENVGLFRQGLLGRAIPLGLVVPRSSANTGIAGHSVRDVDADHLSLVKPSNRESDVYAGTLRFIRKILPPESQQAIATKRARKTEDNIPLRLIFSKVLAYPSIKFAIVNEGNSSLHVTSIRSVIASKAVDNHTGFEYLTGIRTQLEIDVDRATEGAHVDLLDERTISLKPGEIESLSLNFKLSNTTTLIDLDIEYVGPGMCEASVFSPTHLVLAHAPTKDAPGCFELVNRQHGARILSNDLEFRPWRAMAYSDCQSWRYALFRGAGCFLVDDPHEAWEALRPLLARRSVAGPLWASIAEATLRRKMPDPILDSLRNLISDVTEIAKLGTSDSESYATTIVSALCRPT